jgi:hypothetical protein
MNDTPTERASINQLSVDELDDMLAGIRARRLERVKKLEAIAKVKADDAHLVAWLQFEKTYKVAKRALDKLAEQEAKVDALIHKVRLRAFELQA